MILLQGSVSTDKCTESEQLPSSVTSGMLTAPFCQAEKSRQRVVQERGAHWFTVSFLQKASVIFQFGCGVKRPCHDCKHSSGLLAGLPKTACPATPRHSIETKQPLSRVYSGAEQPLLTVRAWGGEHQALDIGSVLFAFVSHHRLCHCWRHCRWKDLFVWEGLLVRRMKERNFTWKRRGRGKVDV